MIRADQIPDEVVEAARYAFHNATGPTVADDWYVAIAAALSAWPGVTTTSWFENSVRKALLNIPMPQEVSDDA